MAELEDLKESFIILAKAMSECDDYRAINFLFRVMLHLNYPAWDGSGR